MKKCRTITLSISKGQIDYSACTDSEINEIDLSKPRKSILFKYSPFTALSQQQKEIIDHVVKNQGNYLIEGGAGTGKTRNLMPFLNLSKISSLRVKRKTTKKIFRMFKRGVGYK